MQLRIADLLIALLLAGLAALLVWLQYPGYLLWGDSFVRWDFAKDIARHGLGFDYSNGRDNWHTTFPTVLMALSWWVRPSYALFVAAFASLGALAAYALLRQVAPMIFAAIVAALIVILPTNAVYFALHMPEPLAATFLLAAVALVLARSVLEPRLTYGGYVTLVCVVFAFALWCRPAAGLSAPIIGWMLAPRAASVRWKAVAAALLTVAGDWHPQDLQC